ncbi:hypothetical protein MHLP_00765 [Candidatus Mycoplasma haematolamae str. Purdue]|uniref:Uncharacterized protein n=1 Tax=Mycoplasma haematolamae (strain Purdue) TaxID=1212765 RepID=I7BIT2_MYCHA|nr:hypothetical protein [Candidatus Mycoplasma haematolamae]AFO51733.1 hypothetical protein MHLP_00765 [Candidatus Mycoplasma haematolamae str. Purdue]
MSKLAAVTSALSVAVGGTIGGGIFASKSMIPPTYNEDSQGIKHRGIESVAPALNDREQSVSKDLEVKEYTLPSWFKGQHLSRLGAQVATLRKVESGWSAQIHYLLNHLEGVYDYRAGENDIGNEEVAAVISTGPCIAVKFEARGDKEALLYLENLSGQDLATLPACGYQWFIRTDNPENVQSEIDKWNRQSEGILPFDWKDSDRLNNQVFGEWDSFDPEGAQPLDKKCKGQDKCIVLRKEIKIPFHLDKRQPFAKQPWQLKAQQEAKAKWEELVKNLKATSN